MAINLLSKKTPKSKAAQEFVPIKEVRDGIVVLKDGALRAVLMTSSINFALKSEEMQGAILMQFQNFLNSLDFMVQIYVQSRRLDIRPYIALLEERYKEQKIDLMKIQTREYIEFVRTFTENSEIMSKNFFVVVPFTPSTLGMEKKNSIGGIFGKKTIENMDAKIDIFEENRTQLEQRVASVEQGLLRTGIRVVQLGSEEVIELFYKIFNPGDTEKPIQIS